jgi:hypothetical protein
LERPDFTARVANHLNPPATKESLATIDARLGAAGRPFQQLYGLHDGMVLYRDLQRRKTLYLGAFYAAGIEFFPVAEWAARSEAMREQIDSTDWGEYALPAWLKASIAFGEIPHSANFFVVGVSEDAGKIFYADHDDFREDPIAGDLEELLDKIRSDPADFLYQCGCYTRYSDGKTDTQWIPKEYVSDAG